MDKWEMKVWVPRGHRYFVEAETGRIAVADDSGETPDETDDGVIYVITDGTIEIGSDGRAVVPCVKPNGKECTVGETFEGAFMMADAFGMAVGVRVRGQTRRVRFED